MDDVGVARTTITRDIRSKAPIPVRCLSKKPPAWVGFVMEKGKSRDLRQYLCDMSLTGVSSVSFADS